MNKRRKRFYSFLRGYLFLFLFIFALLLMDYKTGTAGTGWSPVPYNRPRPNTWEYVFNHLPEIIVFSLGIALLGALPLLPSKDE